MIEKCRILYKGDIMAAGFYLFIGFLLLLIVIIFHYLDKSYGFKFLITGFFMFFVYCTGKGLFMFFVASGRFRFYKNMTDISLKLLKDEAAYTEYRISKKNKNRRVYIYTLVVACILSFAGIFVDQKSLIMGTFIPIALISGIELCIGLLTEFRLREYYRILIKNSPN